MAGRVTSCQFHCAQVTADAVEQKGMYDKLVCNSAEQKAGYDKLIVDNAEQKAQWDKVGHSHNARHVVTNEHISKDTTS